MMKRCRLLPVGVLMVCAAVAQAGPRADAASNGSISGHSSASGGRIDQTANGTVDAYGEGSEPKDMIRQRATKASAKAAARADAKLEASLRRIDQAANQGEQKLEARLEREFGRMPGALLEEKTRLGCTWGELVIAHTLTANGKEQVSVDNLVELRGEGLSWAQIAAGMGLDLTETTSGVKAETQVALGGSAADGKLAVIHGEGAKAGPNLSAGAGLSAGAKAGSGVMGTSAGAAMGGGLGAQTGTALPALPIKP